MKIARVKPQMQSRSPSPRIVLLDLDNTVYNQSFYDEAVIIESSNAYNVLKGSPLMELSLVRRLSAERRGDRHSPNLFDTILAEAGFTPSQINTYLRLYRLSAARISLELRPFPGCTRWLEFARSEGYMIILVTNGRHETQVNKITCLGINEMLDAVLIMDGLDGRSLKPSTDYIQDYLSANGLVYFPSDMIVIGDDLVADMGLASHFGCKYLHPSQLWNASFHV